MNVKIRQKKSVAVQFYHPYATGIEIHPPLIPSTCYLRPKNVTEKTRGHPIPLPPYRRILWPPKSKYKFTTQQAT